MNDDRRMTFGEWESRLALMNQQVEAAEDAGLEVQPEVMDDLRLMMLGAEDKRDQVAWFLGSLESEVEQCEQWMKLLAEKKRALENRIARYEQYVVAVMRQTGSDVLSGTVVKLRVQQNPSRVEVAGEPPAAYARVIPEQREWDKQKVKKAIESGEVVVNARLVPGTYRLARKIGKGKAGGKE